MDRNHYNGRIGMGGFFLDNIRNSIIDDCISSGDPFWYFYCLRDVVADLDDDQSWLEQVQQEEAE